jgi:hypothetical protein
MNSLILIGIILSAIPGFSQCQLSTKTGTYDAICFQKLSRDDFSTFAAEISIVKNRNAGFVVLKLPFSDVKFKGKAYLYLDGNKTITLLDRGQQWKVNGKLFGQFNLSEAEILILKESNISAVRFWVCNEYEDCEDASEYYNKDFTDQLTKAKISRIDFPSLITDLFDD